MHLPKQNEYKIAKSAMLDESVARVLCRGCENANNPILNLKSCFCVGSIVECDNKS